MKISGVPQRFIYVALALTSLAAVLMLGEVLADQAIIRGAAQGVLPVPLIAGVLGVYALSYVASLAKNLQEVALQAQVRRAQDGRHFDAFLEMVKGDQEIEREATAAIPLKRTPAFLRGYLAEIFDAVYESLFLVVATLILFWIDVRMGLVVVLFHPLAAFAGGFIGRKLDELGGNLTDYSSNYLRQLTRALRDRHQIVSFGAPDVALAKLDKSRDAYLAMDQRMKVLISVGMALQTAISQLRDIAVIVLLSVAGRSDMASLFLALYLTNMTVEPVKRWAGHYQSLKSVRELRAQIEQEGTLLPDGLEQTPAAPRDFQLQYTCETLTAGERTLAENVELWTASGHAYLVRGPNGAGKSQLLADVVEQRAQVDGHAAIVLPDGESLALSKVRILRVQGETSLLPGSVLDNVLMFDPTPDPVAMERARDYLGGLLDGADVSNLSGGERQRVHVARALYHNPTVMVLDEALSSLDPKGVDAAVRTLIASLDGVLLLVEHHLRPDSEKLLSGVIYMEDRTVGTTLAPPR